MKSNIFIKTTDTSNKTFFYKSVDKSNQDLFITTNIKYSPLPSRSHSYEVYISYRLKELTSHTPYTPVFPTLQEANQYVIDYLKANHFTLIEDLDLLCYL